MTNTEAPTTMTGGLVHYIESDGQFIDIVLDGETADTVWESADLDAEIPDADTLRNATERALNGSLVAWEFTWHGRPDVNRSTFGELLDEVTVTR